MRYAVSTTEYLLELVRQKIQIVHDSGVAVLSVLVRRCGDHRELRLMQLLGAEATQSRFVNLRKDCFELLALYVVHQTAALKAKPPFWSSLVAFAAKGVHNSADVRVRDAALALLAIVEVERPKLVTSVVKAMNVHLKARYDSDFKSTKPTVCRCVQF